MRTTSVLTCPSSLAHATVASRACCCIGRPPKQFDIDLPGSWWVGDRVRDVLPAETFGALGILVHSRPQAEDENASTFAHASDLRAAVDLILDQQS